MLLGSSRPYPWLILEENGHKANDDDNRTVLYPYIVTFNCDLMFPGPRMRERIDLRRNRSQRFFSVLQMIIRNWKIKYMSIYILVIHGAWWCLWYDLATHLTNSCFIVTCSSQKINCLQGDLFNRSILDLSNFSMELENKGHKKKKPWDVWVWTNVLMRESVVWV